MNYTTEDLVRLKQKPGYGIASDTRRTVAPQGQELRERGWVQKPKADDTKRRPDHRPKKQGPDDSYTARFRVRIAFRFGDRRVRDLDGCAATILDALMSARRSLDEYTGNNSDR